VSTTNVNGHELYYEERGTGTPVLCIHGTSGTALAWEAAAEEFSARGRCIAYDRRGSFRSERPKPFHSIDMSEHTDDAAGLLETFDAVPAVVVGRSYGGGIALDLAARYPDKVFALILLEPAVDTLAPETEDWAEDFLAETLEAGDADPHTVGETFIRALAGDDAWEAFPDELKEVIAGNGPAILAELRGDLVRFTPEMLADIAQPALVAAGVPSAAPRLG
jgi:pimeloyl-ACP methyl ester carboxylesterase